MPATLTYNPLLHAPATAGTQLAPTRRYARYAEIHPSPPLKGLRATHTVTVSYRAVVPAGHGSHGVSPSYRALAPHGAGLASGIEGHRSDATANYSLLTAKRNYTIAMAYHPKNHARLNIFTPDTIQNYACTFHYDPEHPGYDLRTVVLTDGLGRLLQTKKDAEIYGQEKNLVTGKVVYDCFGRTVEQYQPFTDSLGAETLYNDSLTLGTATTVRYDILDRQTYVKTPMNLVTTMKYDFDTCYGKWCLRTTVTDANHNEVKTLTGTLGQQLKQIAPMNTVTRFEYDCLGRLKKSTDPDDISTFYDYDWFGRMVRREHPDAGTDRYHYDGAGNLTSHVNARADSVIYRYDYNLLTDVEFPHYPANDVHYRYGTNANASINAVGKVTMQEDASGWQSFSYGKLGELTENIRTFALPFDTGIYTFKMRYRYDSYNRIQTMTYPDGEMVSYRYNKGGMLDCVVGNKNGVTFKYIDSIIYNKHELKAAVYYGNGAFAEYSYDSLQRLIHLQSTSADGLMQDISYTFDSVGNIIGLQNDALTLGNSLGGLYRCNYTYDDNYRLTSVDGEWEGTSLLSYRINMDYLNNGRIKEKFVEIEDVATGTLQNHYSNLYHYSQNSNKLEAVSNGSSQGFKWDATGNLFYHKKDSQQERFERYLCWDEQNRLQGVVDENHLSYYQYDANGDRTYKLTGRGDLQNISGSWQYFYLLDNATLYASPYLVATDNGYTKHYYAESERIASKIGGGGLGEFSNPLLRDGAFAQKMEANSRMMDKVLDGCLNAKYYEVKPVLHHLYDWQDSVQPEDNCYWYHPDHLGSSSWITHTNGHTVQHLHYLPWGEDFINQKLSGFDGVRFTFSAKEKDAETGYSYFGARYYSSDLSIWMSVDPMSDKYPSLSPYVYCANNPVKLVDIDGCDWVLSTGNKVYWYAGDKGDRSTLLHTYNASSGNYDNDNDYRQAQYQNLRDKGPTPEGEYFINLKPDPERHVGYIGEQNPQITRSKDGGIEQVSFKTQDGTEWFSEEWGSQRALLQPVKVTGATSAERDNNSYYMHDSDKCYTHGCTEVESEFFNQLKDYRNAGNTRIDVIIEYPNEQHKTVSDECNP